MQYPISDTQAAEIEKRFTYHAPIGDQPVRYGLIRGAGKALAETLCKLCPPSCELSLALTNLEQAIMWANAAVSRNE